MSGKLIATPFSMIPMWIIDSVSPRAVVVYAVLRFRAGQKDAAFPSMETIGADARCSADVARRAVRELEAAGALVVEERPGRSSLYRCADGPLANTPGVSSPPADTPAPPRESAGPTPRESASQNHIKVNQIQEPDKSLPALRAGSPVEIVSETSEATGDLAETVEDALPARTRPRDPIFETVAAVCFGADDWSGLTSRERGMANRACKELRAVNATPADVAERAAHFVAWVGQRPTPDNLITHWNRLREPVQKLHRDDLDAFADAERMRRIVADGEAAERQRAAHAAEQSTVTADRRLDTGHPPPASPSVQHPRQEGESVRDYIRRINALTREVG